MGLLKNITSRILTGKTADSKVSNKQELLRKCYFEVMEQRRVLSADPVIAAVTYVEGDDGQDTAPDHFEVTFEGGADTTQLTQFSINGDQDLSGAHSSGDVFFDNTGQFPGTGQHHDFQFDAVNSQGIEASDVQSVSVSDDGLLLIVEVSNFEAGDVFAFTIDVDEVEGLRNDTITSGVEFEGSFFEAQFVDENFIFNESNLSLDTTLNEGFEQLQVEGVFYDEFDNLFSVAEDGTGSQFNVAGDNEEGNENRSAGAIDAFDPEERPVTIEGNVFHDENIDCVHEEGEDGIAGVEISLERLNEETGEYETVATTTTNAAGHYSFGEELDIRPGTFRLTQVQPDGFLNVGEIAGSEGGVVSENVIADIEIPLGGTAATDYDFKEVRPAWLEGNVYHDQDNDGVFDSNEQGIANVLIQVTRVGASDGVTNDVFADTDPVFVRTDANGHYSVGTLPPGIYEIVEINNLPEGEIDPLAAFIDGRDTLGNIDGVPVGQQSNDRFTQVELGADQHGEDYNFGELLPVSIGGNVSVITPGSDPNDPNDPLRDPIEGVTIQLFDETGELVTTTLTDANGDYQFTGLAPGTYSIVEVQPNGFLDATDHLGNVDGELRGEASQNDRFTNITLNSGDVGTNYDFCEHLPASIHGTVYHDRNDNGVQDAGEEGIEGTRIMLTDADGNVVAETFTDAEGNYWFSDLFPGEYTVMEIQPDGFSDGIDSIGTVDGISNGIIPENDKFGSIVLEGGDEGVNYDFGEIREASISGLVHVDSNGNNVYDEGVDELLPGVTIQLLDAEGSIVAETVTDPSGNYSFEGLRPGEYAVRQIQPEGLFTSSQLVGSNGGQATENLISGIIVSSGDQASNYDFCEHLPASIHGTVYHDRNDNGVQDAGEEGIEGTRIMLLDVDGNVVAETLTDADGNYWFSDLVPGEYTVMEIQPDGFADGIDSVGTVDGITNGIIPENDKFGSIVLEGGDEGVNYDFGEIREASISGLVHIDSNGNNVYDEGVDELLPGVTIQLLDADGSVIAETVTDDFGNYTFEGLRPGEYAVRQIQPEGLFAGDAFAGSNGGVVAENLLTTILVSSGDQATNYDFCEHLPAEIHGRVFEDGPAIETEDGLAVEGFRDLRDGVFNASTDRGIEGVVLELYFFSTEDSVNPVQVTLADVLPEFYADLGTTDLDTPITTVTNADGEYWFQGLQAGNYIVLEQQPDGFTDSNDTVGNTTGFTFNSSTEVATAPQNLSTFSTTQLLDAISGIQVEAGGVSLFNNFSEVTFVAEPDDPTSEIPPSIPQPPPPSINPTPPSPGITAFPSLLGAQGIARTELVGNTRGLFEGNPQAAGGFDSFTWHLSVINGGQPRALGESDSVWTQVSHLQNSDWQRYDLNDAVWSFTNTNEHSGIVTETGEHSRFGVIDGTPLAGDFDGDGVDEIAMFKDGYWMIDINHNGRWDDADLLARLGDTGDRPVVGDWDGDGKDDIGIYGPIWERDMEAIEREPGLPNPDNDPHTTPKNVPPANADAADGVRAMRLTSSGVERVDVVDHVFGTGTEEQIPITGDWNGNGIRSIGTFEAGRWNLDTNGDGRFTSEDVETKFGAAGDIPIVGDFDGNGVEEIAIYRAGTWMVDSNGNNELDATDRTFQLGTAADTPVVGDWDGDGVDEPALYRESQLDDVL